MSKLTYPNETNACSIMRPEADTEWITDCFVNYTHACIGVIDEYFKAVTKQPYGIVDCSDYSIYIADWSVVNTPDIQSVYCNSGKMLSVVITHKPSSRCIKIDMSSFVENLVVTTFTSLKLDDQNNVILYQSQANFQTFITIYQLSTLALLTKLYNFLQFGITDIELNQQLITIH